MQVLHQTHGAMELVDVSADLAELKRCPGRTTWEVKDRTGWNSAYDEGLNQVCCLLRRPVCQLTAHSGRSLCSCLCSASAVGHLLVKAVRPTAAMSVTRAAPKAMEGVTSMRKSAHNPEPSDADKRGPV